MAMNENVQLMLGGMNTLGQGVGQAVKSHNDDPKNQKLSPHQKWLGEILSGRMNPKQAAIMARLEAQGGMPAAEQTPMEGQVPGGSGMGQTPMQAPPVDNGFMFKPQGHMPQAAPAPQAAPQMPQARMGGASPAMAPPQRMGGAPDMTPSMPGSTPNSSIGMTPPAPQTQADLDMLMKAAPYFNNKNMTLEQRLFLEAFKGTQRQNLQGQRNEGNLAVAETYSGTKASEGQANRDQKGQIHSENIAFARKRHNDNLALAREKIKSIDDRTKSKQERAYDLEILKTLHQRMIAQLKDASMIQGSLQGDTPEAQAMIEALTKAADDVKMAIDERIISLENEKDIGPKKVPGAPDWAQPSPLSRK